MKPREFDVKQADAKLVSDATDKVGDAIDGLWDLHAVRYHYGKSTADDPDHWSSALTASECATRVTLEDVLDVLAGSFNDHESFRSAVIETLDRMEKARPT